MVRDGRQVPQLTRIGAELGIACFSGGGFDGLSGKRDAALRAMEGDRKTVVLHLGDYDPSREHLFSSLAEDVIAFAEASGGEVAFERVAVAPEQIITYGLPTVLQDRRGPLDRVTLPRATSAPSAQPVRRGWSGTSRGFGWRTFRPRRRWPERRPSVGGWPIWYDRSPEEMTRRAAGSSS